jgi:hypothetical protein
MTPRDHTTPESYRRHVRAGTANPGKDRDSVSDESEVAKLLMLNFPGWRCWFGSMTATWWSLPPHGHPYKSLIEARSAQELAVMIRGAETLLEEPR